MPRYEDLPIAPAPACACSIARACVFIGRRTDGPEHVDATHVWQMPQGGIDEGEEPYRRRCANSTRRPTSARSSSSARSRTGSPMTSRATIAGQAWKGKYRGQTQKWFALRFTGKDREIDIAHPGGGTQAGIRRMALGADGKLPDLVVPFKRRSTSGWSRVFRRWRSRGRSRVMRRTCRAKPARRK